VVGVLKELLLDLADDCEHVGLAIVVTIDSLAQIDLLP
jgi:hypothetical protein